MQVTRRQERAEREKAADSLFSLFSLLILRDNFFFARDE